MSDPPHSATIPSMSASTAAIITLVPASASTSSCVPSGSTYVTFGIVGQSYHSSMLSLTDPVQELACPMPAARNRVVSRDGQNVANIHARLREAILSGDMAGREVTTQVALGESLGAGRTPIREALRLLQREGLVIAEPNRRVRVAELSADDAESLYVSRIALEVAALRITVPPCGRRTSPSSRASWPRWSTTWASATGAGCAPRTARSTRSSAPPPATASSSSSPRASTTPSATASPRAR